MTYKPPTKEEYQRALAFSHYGGAAAAIEDCAGRLKAKAEKFFGYGHSDDEAHLLRDLANEFTKLGKTERVTQQEFNLPGDPRVDR